MSVISNIHTATVYDAKHTKAFDGQRLVVTIAKKDKDGNYGQHLQQTMATSIPMLAQSDIDFTNADIRDACVAYFQTVQNAIINDNIKSGIKDIRTEDIGQSGIISYLNSETVGDKWTAERISAWFTDNIAENLGLKLIDIGCSDDDMEKRLNVAQKRFSDTLASKAKIGDKLAVELNKMLGFASDKDSAIYIRFYNRVNPEVVDLADSLGF